MLYTKNALQVLSQQGVFHFYLVSLKLAVSSAQARCAAFCEAALQRPTIAGHPR